MSRTVGGADADSLERSSSRRADSIRFGPKAYGVERAEVYLSTCAFSPHRHDTYAIGITTAGVQTFRYRGSRCVCLPGQLHVLHPDEAHDGAAGTEDGFSYRILYIAPELIRGALAGRALPFVADPVQDPTPAVRPIASLLADIDDPISELSCAEIATAAAAEPRSTSGQSGSCATISPLTRASRRRPRSSKRSRASTASPSLAISAGRSGRAPTGTGRCAAWRWRRPRSRAGSHSRKSLPRSASLTRAT